MSVRLNVEARKKENISHVGHSGEKTVLLSC